MPLPTDLTSHCHALHSWAQLDELVIVGFSTEAKAISRPEQMDASSRERMLVAGVTALVGGTAVLLFGAGGERHVMHIYASVRSMPHTCRQHICAPLSPICCVCYNILHSGTLSTRAVSHLLTPFFALPLAGMQYLFCTSGASPHPQHYCALGKLPHNRPSIDTDPELCATAPPC